MKVVGYISSYKHDQVEKSVELKIQREKIEDFCIKQGYQLAKIYEEPPESRQDYKPALLKLLNNSTKKEFEKVIVLKLDILDLDSKIRAWIIGELKKNNIEAYSLTESYLGSRDKESENSLNKAKTIREKVRDIPSLPEIVTRVIELVQDPRSSAAQLSKVISHDPGLTSRVLRLVNSAYYGFPKQISSIQHAIMILGFTTMRGLVLSSSIFKIFAPKGDIRLLDYKKFWKHCLVTAISAKIINNYLQFQDEEDLFSAAILHDIGKIILDQYDHDDYIMVLQDAPDPVKYMNVLEAEQKYCEITHQEIGYMVAEGWNLPESLIEVIRYHHFPLESANNTKLASIVSLGNTMSHVILDSQILDFQLFDNDVLDFLGLNDDDLAAIRSIVIEEIENIGDLESFFK